MNKLTFREAKHTFSSPKKVLKIADKAFERGEVEFMLKAEEGKFSVYEDDSNQPVCPANTVIESLAGYMFVSHGIGKVGENPAWCQSDGFNENMWRELNYFMHMEESQNPLPNLENMLNNGSVLYYSNQGQKDNMVLTNQVNPNITDKIILRGESFSDNLMQAENMASYVMAQTPDVEQ